MLCIHESISIHQSLRPFKWLRKIREFRLVYTPLLAIVLFTAVMGIILGTLHLQEKNQQEAALFRELSFAKQRIQSRFASNLDAFTTINREVASGEDQAKLRQIARELVEQPLVSLFPSIYLVTSQFPQREKSFFGK